MLRYTGRHRLPVRRTPARPAFASITLSVIGATLVAPESALADVHPPVPSFRDYQRVSWLAAPDIVVNPPGPAAGALVAPAVDRGYVITGDHLHDFEITGTAAADAELRGLVERVGPDEDGRPLDVAGYRVFVTPSIQSVQVMDEFWTLVATIQQVGIEYTDPENVEALLNALIQRIPHIDHEGTDDIAFLLRLAEAALYYVTHPPVDPGVVVARIERARRRGERAAQGRQPAHQHRGRAAERRRRPDPRDARRY